MIKRLVKTQKLPISKCPSQDCKLEENAAFQEGLNRLLPTSKTSTEAGLVVSSHSLLIKLSGPSKHQMNHSECKWTAINLKSAPVSAAMPDERPLWNRATNCFWHLVCGYQAGECVLFNIHH